MKDLLIKPQGEHLFEIVNDDEALKSQLNIFLITKWGEIEQDETYGLDYRGVLLRSDIKKSFKINHIIEQVNSYFSEQLSSAPKVELEEKGRDLKFNVKYVSVYGNEGVISI